MCVCLFIDSNVSLPLMHSLVDLRGRKSQQFFSFHSVFGENLTKSCVGGPTLGKSCMIHQLALDLTVEERPQPDQPQRQGTLRIMEEVHIIQMDLFVYTMHHGGSTRNSDGFVC